MAIKFSQWPCDPDFVKFVLTSLVSCKVIYKDLTYTKFIKPIFCQFFIYLANHLPTVSNAIQLSIEKLHSRHLVRLGHVGFGPLSS